jgi:hypothetical protein
MPDVFGLLVGKRFTAPFFLQSVAEHGTHGCNYLLIDEPLRGLGERRGVGGCGGGCFAKEQAVRHEGMDVGVEVQVFAEGVQGEDDTAYALRAIEGCPEILGDAFMRESTEFFEQAAMTLKIGAQHFGNRQDVMPVRHRRQHLVYDEFGSGLDVFLEVS